MKKFNWYIAIAVAYCCLTAARAGAEDAVFLGGFYGARLGVNHSKASGIVEVPRESTVAYIVQGGYVQGGYNIKLGAGIIGVGGYADMHGYERHLNGVAYGSHAYGLDVKLAIPVNNWLSYAKLGYGYSAGTSYFRDIKQFGFNKAFGVEYKLDVQWSAVAEFKFNNFQKNSTMIENQTFMFGFNYYFEKPIAAPEPEIEVDLTEPVKEAAPDIPPEFAPPP